jgi:hypothetical protein
MVAWRPRRGDYSRPLGLTIAAIMQPNIPRDPPNTEIIHDIAGYVRACSGVPHGWRAPGQERRLDPRRPSMAKTRRTFTPEFK